MIDLQLPVSIYFRNSDFQQNGDKDKKIMKMYNRVDIFYIV